MRVNEWASDAVSIYEPLAIHGASVGLVDRLQFIVDHCRGKSVLHVGCSDWPVTSARLRSAKLLHRALGDSARELLGIDTSAPGIDLMTAAGISGVFLGDIESPPDSISTRRFDIVLAGEVVEHLDNPVLALRAMRRLLEPGGEVIVTVPNAYSAANFLNFFLGTEKVHRDHCYYFSPKTIFRLLDRADFELQILGFAARPTRSSIADKIFIAIERIMPRLSGGVVAVARVKPDRPVGAVGSPVRIIR